jgi:hypothetical protein
VRVDVGDHLVVVSRESAGPDPAEFKLANEIAGGGGGDPAVARVRAERPSTPADALRRWSSSCSTAGSHPHRFNDTV